MANTTIIDTVLNQNGTEDLVQRLAAYGREEIVPIDRLLVDKSYQRDLREVLVRSIAVRYDPAVVGRPLVSLRTNGFYYIMDGQHRVEAARRCGDTHIPCTVLSGLSIEQEARIFDRTNRVRARPFAFQLHRTALTFDPTARAIDAILAEFGYEFVARNGVGVGRVRCVDEIYTIYGAQIGSGPNRQGRRSGAGPDLLRSVLRVAHGAFEGDQDGLQADFLRGLSLFLYKAQKDPMYNERHLIQVMRDMGIKKLLREARAAGDYNGNRLPGGLQIVLQSAYNKGLKTKRITINPQGE